MDLDLESELRLAGGYAGTLSPQVRARILAWERACTRRGYRGYVTRLVGERAKESAFGIYGGSFLRDPHEPARLRVRCKKIA